MHGNGVHFHTSSKWHSTTRFSRRALKTQPFFQTRLSAAEALKDYRPEPLKVESHADPEALVAVILRERNSPTPSSVVMLESYVLKGIAPTFTLRGLQMVPLEVCFSSERRPRHAKLLLDPACTEFTPWNFRATPQLPIADRVGFQFCKDGMNDGVIISFDGMKYCGLPLVLDRWHSVWIEDRCDAAVLVMTSRACRRWTNKVRPNSSRPPRVAVQLPVVHFKLHWRDGARDIIISRAMREVFYAGVLLSACFDDFMLDSLRGHDLEDEVKAVLFLAGRHAENVRPLSSRLVEAVTDMSCCFGLEVYNFLRLHAPPLSVEDAELLLRLAQLAMHTRGLEREQAVKFLECNQWLYDIFNEGGEALDELCSENVSHPIAKLLIDVLSFDDEFEDLAVEPLQIKDVVPNHNALQLAAFQPLERALVTDSGSVALPWVGNRVEISADVDEIAPVWDNDRTPLRTIATKHGAVFISKRKTVPAAQGCTFKT